MTVGTPGLKKDSNTGFRTPKKNDNLIPDMTHFLDSRF
jgi:hypothetical protein